VAMALQDADDIGWSGKSGGMGGAAEAKSMTGHSDGRGNGAEGAAKASCGSKLSPGLLGVIKAETSFCAQLAIAENFENATFLQVPHNQSACARTNLKAVMLSEVFTPPCWWHAALHGNRALQTTHDWSMVAKMPDCVPFQTQWRRAEHHAVCLQTNRYS
jgi:hypothetical protein